MYISNDMSQIILNVLYFVQVSLWIAIVEWVTVIKFAGDKWVSE